MSLQITNTLSPGLARLIRQCKNTRPILEAMGQQAKRIERGEIKSMDASVNVMHEV